ncbi:MAG: hypothetical protein ACR2OI_06875 [Acidimicrobiia bacterium]
MEFITAPLGPLQWVLTPVGILAALGLFGFVVSGLAGRILPNLEVSSGTRRSSRTSSALAAAPRRERITT